MAEVSVILPNYNHGSYLKKRIDSILTQSFQAFELIILDDCSSDNSREVIERYRGHPKVARIEYNEVNSGSPFIQWSKGIQYAGADLIWIAESDDGCESSFLEKTVLKMKEYASVGIVYVQSIEFEEKSNKTFVSFQDHPLFSKSFDSSYFETGKMEIARHLVYENTIPNASGVLFRKDIYLKCGGVDETMRLCGDWYLWTKMLFESDIYFLAEPLNHFRLTSISARSRYSLIQTLHERLTVLHFIKEHNIHVPEKTGRELIRRLFNSYKLSQIKIPVRSVLAERKLIDNPKREIAEAIFLSLFARIRRKLTGPVMLLA
ncbi:MAG: glycosyltransferase [Ferruginibacter sp.]